MASVEFYASVEFVVIHHGLNRIAEFFDQIPVGHNFFCRFLERHLAAGYQKVEVHQQIEYVAVVRYFVPVHQRKYLRYVRREGLFSSDKIFLKNLIQLFQEVFAVS